MKLGDKVRDVISGFSGLAVGRTQWLLGCERIGIEPIGLQDGKIQETVFFDLDRIEVVEAGFFASMRTKAPGRQADIPAPMDIGPASEGEEDGEDDDAPIRPMQELFKLARHQLTQREIEFLLEKHCKSYTANGNPCSYHSHYPGDPKSCQGGPPSTGEDTGGQPCKQTGGRDHGWPARRDS